MYYRTLALLCLLGSSPSWSFDCYYTLAKDSCWTNYNVSVDVVDDASSSTLITVSAPAGTPWVRQKFSCQPAQKIMFRAQFTPVFWKDDVGKTYGGIRYWFMPGTIKPGDSAWNIPNCFASDFSEVPLPPDAKGNCACDFSVIPAIPPKQLTSTSSRTK